MVWLGGWVPRALGADRAQFKSWLWGAQAPVGAAVVHSSQDMVLMKHDCVLDAPPPRAQCVGSAPGMGGCGGSFHISCQAYVWVRGLPGPFPAAIDTDWPSMHALVFGVSKSLCWGVLDPHFLSHSQSLWMEKGLDWHENQVWRIKRSDSVTDAGSLTLALNRIVPMSPRPWGQVPAPRRPCSGGRRSAFHCSPWPTSCVRIPWSLCSTCSCPRAFLCRGSSLCPECLPLSTCPSALAPGPLTAGILPGPQPLPVPLPPPAQCSVHTCNTGYLLAFPLRLQRY